MTTLNSEKSLTQKSKKKAYTDNFHFFAPVEIEKSKKKDGKVEMKIKGIASTIDVDSDQEILEPEGFVLDKFLSTGFFNYNHKSSTDPTSIVGEPTNAYVKKGALMVEGFLYPDSQKAEDLWKTIQVVRNGSSKRRIGMSIEGKALERDPLNPKRITKALITGCAITPTPKNASTLVEVMKGEVDYSDYEYEVIKSENGGEIEYLIDVIDNDGFRRTVDKNFNISVKKMDLAAYGATSDSYGVTAESVEGTKRRGKSAIKNVVGTDFFEKKDKNFSKSEVYSKIFTTFTTDISKAKEIYGLMERIESLNNTKEMGDISQETIDKAAELFSLTTEDDKVAKSTEGDVKDEALNKSEDNDKDDEESMKKALEEYKGKVKELEMKIASRAGVKEENSMDAPDEDGGTITKKGEDEGDIKKSEDLEKPATDTINKSEVADIIKSEVAEIVKGFETSIVEKVSDKLKAVGELYLTQKDAQDDVESKLDQLTKSIETIGESVKEIGDQPATGRRGIISKASIERFKEENGDDAVVLSKSVNRGQLVEVLYEKSNLEKGEGIDNQLVKAMQDIEGVGEFSDPTVASRLKKEYNLHIIN